MEAKGLRDCQRPGLQPCHGYHTVGASGAGCAVQYARCITATTKEGRYVGRNMHSSTGMIAGHATRKASCLRATPTALAVLAMRRECTRLVSMLVKVSGSPPLPSQLCCNWAEFCDRTTEGEAKILRWSLFTLAYSQQQDGHKSTRILTDGKCNPYVLKYRCCRPARSLPSLIHQAQLTQCTAWWSLICNSRPLT